MNPQRFDITLGVRSTLRGVWTHRKHGVSALVLETHGNAINKHYSSMARPRNLCHTERGSFVSGELRSIFSSGQRSRAHGYLRVTSWFAKHQNRDIIVCTPNLGVLQPINNNQPTQFAMLDAPSRHVLRFARRSAGRCLLAACRWPRLLREMKQRLLPPPLGPRPTPLTPPSPPPADSPAPQLSKRRRRRGLTRRRRQRRRSRRTIHPGRRRQR